jgi:hypothetical protein
MSALAMQRLSRACRAAAVPRRLATRGRAAPPQRAPRAPRAVPPPSQSVEPPPGLRPEPWTGSPEQQQVGGASGARAPAPPTAA